MNKKLSSWLIANGFSKQSKSIVGGAILFVFSHQARALIALYILINNKCKIVTFLLRRFLRSHYHIECSCKTIGSYFMLPHPHNIIIAAESIGDYVQINQNVTLGGNMRKTKQRSWGVQKLPILKNHVVIYSNAVVGGPVIVNEHVIIGANCTCTHDVEANTMLFNQTKVSTRKIEVLIGTYRIKE